MPIGEASGEFNNSVISSTFERLEGGSSQVVINIEVIGLTGEGCWEKVDGEQKWRVRGINMASNGQVLLSDGTLDLATRSFAGTISEWS